jgi:hypothetical protein
VRVSVHEVFAIYFQLSASLKLRVTEYGALVLVDSLPVATCWAVVDSVTAGLQEPELPPVTLPQVTVTAEVGTVPQPVNEVAVACT